MSPGPRLATAAAFGILGFSVLDPRDASAQVRSNSCVTCHASLSAASLAAPAKETAGDVHDKAGVRCADCHGGNPAATDKARAHDPARGYRGKPAGATICASCHVLFAEKFAASVHAPIFERACVECHGNHGVAVPAATMLGTGKDAICVTCHTEADDPGFVGAAKMKSSIDRFSQAIETRAGVVGQLRNAGMEVGDQELGLTEARTKLVLARTEMHAFTPTSLDGVVDEGMKIVASVDEAATRASAELVYRRRGLFISLGAILLFVVALALKIRTLDQRH